MKQNKWKHLKFEKLRFIENVLCTDFMQKV